MTCGACEKLISKRIMRIDGVIEVAVKLPGSATITASRDISVEEVQKVLEGTHYIVS